MGILLISISTYCVKLYISLEACMVECNKEDLYKHHGVHSRWSRRTETLMQLRDKMLMYRLLGIYCVLRLHILLLYRHETEVVSPASSVRRTGFAFLHTRTFQNPICFYSVASEKY
jgi:hypothetical protein